MGTVLHSQHKQKSSPIRLAGRILGLTLALLALSQAAAAASIHAPVVRTGDLQAEIGLRLSAEPAYPLPGELVHFEATLSPNTGEAGQVAGRLVLPEGFKLAPDSRMDWQGSLVNGVEQVIEIRAIWAGPGSPGEACYIIDWNGGSSTAVLPLAAPAPPPVQLQPELFSAPPQSQGVLRTPIERTAPEAPPAQAAPRLVDFALVEVPLEDGALLVRLYLLANLPVSQARLEIGLSPGLEHLSGPTRWLGELKKGEWALLELTLRPAAESRPALSLSFSSAQGSQEIISYALSELDYPNDPDAGDFTTRGRFTYLDKQLNATGAGEATFTVYDRDDPGDDDVVCGPYAVSANGDYSCSGSASDPYDDTLEVYVEICAYNYWYGQVEDMDGDIYCSYTESKDTPESGGVTRDFGTRTVTDSPAFALLANAARSNQTAWLDGGEAIPHDGQEHFLTIRWPTNEDSSFFTTGDWSINIAGPGSPSDNDTWDQSVFFHEYGHYMMSQFAVHLDVDYCHDPGETDPDCFHTWTSVEDLKTAYVEGRANYFHSSVKQAFGLPDPEIYTDTQQTGFAPIRHNVEIGCPLGYTTSQAKMRECAIAAPLGSE